MNKLPQLILDKWSQKMDAVVVTTVNKDGMPNSIYATCVSIYNGEKILIANNFFNKTLANIKSNCTGSVLFITKNNNSYQIKGTFQYQTEGVLYDDMKKWNPENLPGKGVAVLTVEEIYSGSRKIDI